MLKEIITHTPLWVWAILAFLLFRGVIASKDRSTTIKSVAIIPVVMLCLALQGIASGFGANGATLGIWLACALASAALSWRLAGENFVTAQPQQGQVLQHGSWVPLAIMMGIFMMKYAVGISMGMHPELATNSSFILATCAAYGVFNGIFLGRLLRTVTIYRAALQPAGLAA